MNIKQASEQSGVSAPNIRFYEKEGLLTPARQRDNSYRTYTEENIRTLKLIRMLRMLDVPLPTIKAVLRGEQPLQQALQAQQTVLEQQAAHLAAAMQFCADLARIAVSFILNATQRKLRVHPLFFKAELHPVGLCVGLQGRCELLRSVDAALRNKGKMPLVLHLCQRAVILQPARAERTLYGRLFHPGQAGIHVQRFCPVSYTHLTLPTT